MEESPIRPKRCPVGVADWRTLSGSPRPIPVVPDLSQAVSAMGSLRRDDEDHDCSCARTHRRWKIERLFAWLQNLRRLVVRYERHAENFLGMLHLASSLILLRYL